MVNRLMDGRLRKLESVAHPTGPARTFRMIVDGVSDREAEIARFKAENGVTDDDLLIVRVLIGPGEAQKTPKLAVNSE